MQNSQLSLLYKWQKLFILSDNTVQSWFVTGRNKEWKSDLDLSQYLILKPDQGHQALLWSRGQGQVRMNFHQKQDQVLVHTGLETLYFEWFEITYWAHEKCESLFLKNPNPSIYYHTGFSLLFADTFVTEVTTPLRPPAGGRLQPISLDTAWKTQPQDDKAGEGNYRYIWD